MLVGTGKSFSSKEQSSMPNFTFILPSWKKVSSQRFQNVQNHEFTVNTMHFYSKKMRGFLPARSFYQPDSNKKKGFETTGRSRNEKQGIEMIRQELKRKGKNRNEKEGVEICRKE